MTIKEIFGRNLQKFFNDYYKSRGLGQKEFAKDLGVTQGSVSKWLNRELLPKKDIIWRIAKTLNVPIQNFFVPSPSAGDVLTVDDQEEIANFKNDPLFSLLVEDYKDFKILPEKYKSEVLSEWNRTRLLLKNRVAESLSRQGGVRKKSGGNDLRMINRQMESLLSADSPVFLWEWHKNDFYLIFYNEPAAKLNKNRLAGLIGVSARLLFATSPELVDDLVVCYQRKKTLVREIEHRLVTTGEVKSFHLTYKFMPPNLILEIKKEIKGIRKHGRQIDTAST